MSKKDIAKMFYGIALLEGFQNMFSPEVRQELYGYYIAMTARGAWFVYNEKPVITKEFDKESWQTPHWMQGPNKTFPLTRRARQPYPYASFSYRSANDSGVIAVSFQTALHKILEKMSYPVNDWKNTCLGFVEMFVIISKELDNGQRTAM